MKKLLPILLVFTLLVSAVWAETGESTRSLDEIVDYALENNPDLEDAAFELRSARENLTGTFTFDKSTLTGSAGWDSDSSDEVSSSLSLSIPVTDQVSLSGSWDIDDSSGSTGVSVKPLNLTTTAASSQTSLKKAGIELNYLTAALSDTVVLGVLNYIHAEQDFNLQHENALLAVQQYDAGYAQYLEDEITYEDLQDLNDELTTAQRQEIETEISLADSRAALLLLLGPEADFLPEKVSDDLLYEMIREQKSRIGETGNQPASSQELENATADYDFLKVELSKTLVFQPDITVSAEASFETGTTPTIEAGLSISLSPTTFDQTNRNQLIEEVELQLRDLQLEEFEVGIELESAMGRITAAEKEAELAKTDIERQQILYNENLLLAEHGERTLLEVEDARLSLAAAELNLTSSLISIYEAQADYLAYFP